MENEITVTQADRDAAANYYRDARPQSMPANVRLLVREGKADDDVAVQAFARHRLSTQPETKVVEGRLWLWSASLGEPKQYVAYDNPWPVGLDHGDPLTLGEPMGWAYFKPSRNGSNGRTEEEAEAGCRRAALTKSQDSEVVDAEFLDRRRLAAFTLNNWTLHYKSGLGAEDAASLDVAESEIAKCVIENIDIIKAALTKSQDSEAVGLRTLDEWHDDHGFVTWWKFPVVEPAWIGTPNCSDWPGYHTHWTPHPKCPDTYLSTNEGEGA